MEFKVDENLPIEIAELLISAGYNAKTINEQQLQGVKDPLLIDNLQERGACSGYFGYRFLGHQIISTARIAWGHYFESRQSCKTTCYKSFSKHSAFCSARTPSSALMDCG